MKLGRISGWAAICSVAGVSQAGAALMGLSAPVGSPYFADFTENGLSFTDTYSSANQTATFTISTLGTQGDSYASGPQAPGTHGSTTLGPNNNNTFTGSFSMTAAIQLVGGNWVLQSGTFDVYGNLMGGTTSDLLLAGNLESGASGPGGTFGFRTSTTDPKRFEFLYTVNTTQNAGNGNNTILQDWAASKPVGTTVQGAMILNVTSSAWNWTGDWSKPWVPGTANGQGDVFAVPEASSYGWLGAGLAAFVVVAGRRNKPEARQVAS